jgi:hemerythrin-like metal-binding protein
MTILVTWQPSYDVHISKCNDQHQQLFDIINELATAIDERKNREITQPILDKLLQYTKIHFTEEQEILLKHNYPLAAYNEQKEQHLIFINKIEQARKDFIENNVAVSIGLLLFLQGWLVKHIMDVDKKYTKFFKEKGIFFE